MKKLQLKQRNKMQFIDYFIAKEKNFLYRLNAEAFYDKDFKFYIAWYIYAIDDYMNNNYNIEERFIFFFTNNFNLNIKFFIYIMNADFRQRVINDILEYKRKYRKENIYE